MSKAKEKEETGIALYKKDTFLALGGGDEDLREALEAVAEVGETFGPNDLTRVSVPSGGGTTWEIPGAVVEKTEAIIGALVFVQKQGLLWPKEEPEEGSMPVLQTYDLKVARQVGPIPDDMIDVLSKHEIGEGLYDWENLPYNQFGSAKGGEGDGKRCREQRLLFILREGDIYPMTLAVPPGSLKNWRIFFRELPKFRLPYWRAIVSLSLEKAKSKSGQQFSRIVPSLVGHLGKDDGGVVKQQYTDKLKDMVVSGLLDGDDEETAASAAGEG